MRMDCESLCCVASCCFVFAAGSAGRNSQAQAVWQGILRNAAGAPIAGAKIRLQPARAVKAEAITGADGQFQLPRSACRSIPPHR